MKLDVSKTAIVLIEPQNDFLKLGEPCTNT